MTNFLSTNLSKHEVRESPPYSIQAELQAIPSSSRRLMQIRFSIVGCRAFVWLCNRVMCVYVACLCSTSTVRWPMALLCLWLVRRSYSLAQNGIGTQASYVTFGC